MSTRFLSFDASTKHTGYAFFENGKLIDAKVINVENSDCEMRIKEMGLLILKCMDYYNPEIVWIEDTYCGGNKSTQRKLDRLQGVVFSWCLLNDADFQLVMPKGWRKLIPNFPVSAKREEAKLYSINYVKEKYGVNVTDDIADAICIGEAAIRFFDDMG